jgi:hypothetical protein
VSTRDIRTSDAHSSCDVCGRTLLRGERAEVFLAGGSRRTVCELCTDRAVHEGWLREGSAPIYDGTGSSRDRRRSLLGRLRSRREPAVNLIPPARGIELDGAEPLAPIEPAEWPEPVPAPVPAPAPARRRERIREPRHVRAVPSGVEQKVAAAIDVFNTSEHRRTVAGVARSLGAPAVAVLASDVQPSVVTVVVSWELCWYRYELDLSEETPTVRIAGQGYELDELPPEEKQPNAAADEHGGLVLGG